MEPKRAKSFDPFHQLEIWIPDVQVARHERTGDFMLIQFGTMEGHGASFALGPLVPVPKTEMEGNGWRIIHECLRSYRRWPIDTKFNSELTTMSYRERSKFYRSHQFSTVLQRDAVSICLSPLHRDGPGWRGITGFIEEEQRFKFPITQKKFFTALMTALDSAR
jgi:hypothetical protein